MKNVALNYSDIMSGRACEVQSS